MTRTLYAFVWYHLQMGSYKRGDKVIEITWGDKISKSLRSLERATITCEVCRKDFEVPKNARFRTRFCSRQCGQTANYTNVTGVRKKAIVISANLLMGKGKTEKVEALLNAAMGSPCRYCREILTLENISIDHKEPYGDFNRRDKSPETKEARAKLDRIENLEAVCFTCNGMKNKLFDYEYQALIDFLDAHPRMKPIILQRMRQAIWGAGYGTRMSKQ